MVKDFRSLVTPITFIVLGGISQLTWLQNLLTMVLAKLLKLTKP